MCLIIIWSSYAELKKGHNFITASYLTEKNPAIVKSMSSNFASQCGFCSPGMATKIYQHQSHRKSLKIGKCSNSSNAIKDNLCRCTGYRPILQACKDCEVIDIEDLGWFSNWALLNKNWKLFTVHRMLYSVAGQSFNKPEAPFWKPFEAMVIR